MKCHWWNRWYHSKLRRLDVQMMLPAIERAASRYGETDLVTAKTVWEKFKKEPGQEHWQCQCAKEERRTP